MRTKAAIALLAIISMTACITRGPVQAQAQGSGSGQSAVSGMLIYSDQSPGALVWGEGWKLVAESNGEALTVVTDATEFAAKLAAGDWSEVHVVARYAPGEPAYAAALRAFASAHPDTMVQMFLWHDNGTSPTPDTAVAASMANFLWSRGGTTISYTGVGNPKAGKPRAVPGLVFPDFSGIAVVDPTILIQAPSGGAAAASSTALTQSVITIITSGTCVTACLNTFLQAITACQSAKSASLDQCDELYGPSEGPPPDPGDPAALEACRQQVNATFQACLDGAANDANRCILLCDRNTTVQ